MLGDAFWAFSIATYRKKNIASLCLRLQDEEGCDVNMVLFCLWAGTSRGQVPRADMRSATEFSRQWRDTVVDPLRHVRRQMKGVDFGFPEAQADAPDHLRDNVKALELKAEEMQQRRLEAFADLAYGETGESAASANFETYLDLMSLDPTSAHSPWRQLVAAAAA